MDIENTAPCRHAGAPPSAVVERVAQIIQSLATEASFLSRKGLTAEEYALALPLAIEKIRGSKSASNSGRRSFLMRLLKEMETRNLVSKVEVPTYGDDTIYRVSIPAFGDVAIIQKGCPDGAHSSVRWERPEWAVECYLWWMCSSVSSEPGVHIWKGINRLRGRFFSEQPGIVDGVVFHNELCGTSERPCPKAAHSIDIDGVLVPPPCLYVMPERIDGVEEWNWNGARELRFPVVLNALFGLTGSAASSNAGQVGFKRRGPDLRTTVSYHFGPGRATSYRS